MFLREGINTKAFAAAEKELKAYANKPGQRGGIDSKHFIDVAGMLGQISRINILQAGQKLAHLNKKLKRMDTSPREKVYSVLQTHGLMESAESIKEKMTEKQMKKREKIVKSMKKDKKGFENRYGDKADAVMYATATKMAMDEKLDDKDKPFVKKLVKNLRKGSAIHGKQADDLEKAMKTEAIKHTHMVLDPDGKVMSMHSNERSANDSAKPTGNLLKKQGKVVKLRKPVSTTRGDRLIGQLPAHNLGEDVERRADVKMVKVRLPDGTQVMRRQRPEIKIGEKKSPNAVRTEGIVNTIAKKVADKTKDPNTIRRMTHKAASAVANATEETVNEKTIQFHTGHVPNDSKSHAAHRAMVNSIHKKAGDNVTKRRSGYPDKSGKSMVGSITVKKKQNIPAVVDIIKKHTPKSTHNSISVSEETINEGVIDDLKKIVKRKSRADVKFANGRRTKVDLFTASAMTQVYDKLNDKNKQKFADAINKDERMFMKMMDFAMTKVGGK